MRSLSLRLLASAATIAVALAVVALRPGQAQPTATPSATFVDGDFTHSNSRDGMPVLEHPNLGPGHSVEGTVTIANTGTLGGRFFLSAHDLDETAGMGGGVLTERLSLTVTDTVAAAAVYAGPLDELDSIPLGYYDADEAHTYHVSARFPHGGDDDDYAGAETRVRFVWDAVQADPPAGGEPTGSPPPAASPAATEPLRLLVRAPAVQRFLQRRRLLVRVACNRPCRIATRGTVRVAGRTVPLRTRLTRVPRSGFVRPRVRLPRGLRADARTELAQRRRIVYTLRFSARDGIGLHATAARELTVSEHGHAGRARVAARPIEAPR